jgi:ABC-type Zn uptake system ZnuABC Zn-binding protein ZnuA
MKMNLDPYLAIRYIENIRDGLSEVDPEGEEVYGRNAADTIARLKELDGWIQEQVAQIPPERRILVTNHESFGYFADRYGLTIVGTVLPGASTGVAPSAKELAGLVKIMKEYNVPAIFLETGANPQLAGQIAQETGARVVEGLYSHSLSAPGGPAANYFEMMRYNTQAIVVALK